LQLPGGTNWRQLPHCCSPFGWSWYFIAAFDAFACAKACLDDTRPAHAAPASATLDISTDRRENF
jgi:hypothetical protein